MTPSLRAHYTVFGRVFPFCGNIGREAAVAEGRVPGGYSERLYNEDLAPAKERKWGTYSLFALWMSDVHNLGNYTFAAGLFVLGPTAWEVWSLWRSGSRSSLLG